MLADPSVTIEGRDAEGKVRNSLPETDPEVAECNDGFIGDNDEIDTWYVPY